MLADEINIPVYHINVLMCIATKFTMIGLEMIRNQSQKIMLLERFEQSNKEIINLTIDQVKRLAGNALELLTPSGNILVISKTAYNVLTERKILQIEQYVRYQRLN
jgi:hypothetical protein